VNDLVGKRVRIVKIGHPFYGLDGTITHICDTTQTVKLRVTLDIWSVPGYGSSDIFIAPDLMFLETGEIGFSGECSKGDASPALAKPPKCKTCVWFEIREQWKDIRGGDVEVGACHYNPPDANSFTGHPVVNENGFCSKHQVRT